MKLILQSSTVPARFQNLLSRWRVKNRWIFLGGVLAVLVLALAAGLTWAQDPGPQGGEYRGQPVGTAFTYQGYLRRDGRPYNGSCDFLFSLWSDASEGSEVAIGQSRRNVQVTNGLFTIPDLDFGAGVFQGDARWLQIAVKCAGDADYVILSPRQRLTPAPYALALPGLWTRENVTSTNIIGGYSGNSVAPGVVGATISGGGSSETTCGAFSNEPCINRVTDNYGTVGGGRYNQAGDNTGTATDKPFATVGGGVGNIASGSRATVGGGTTNTASGFAATVGGGGLNTANNYFATVSGGADNIASGYAATVPGGRGALASHYGEMAYASGYFSTTGDAQTSVYVLRNTTSGTASTELFLDGTSARLTIAPGRTVVFDILIVGRSNAGESAGYVARGVIENVGNTTRLHGLSWGTLHEDDIAWDTFVEADDVNDALRIRVQGGTGDTIRWVATVRTVEVSQGGGVP